MPYFRYKAADQNNKNQEGIIQAASQDVAADILSDRGLTILNLTEERLSFRERSLKLLNRVKIKDLVVFSRQLSVIVSATIPLVQGLRIIVAQTESPVLKTIISEVADDVEGGAKLSSALARHDHVFSPFFINIIKSGEASGKLDDVLNYLADQQEQDYDLTSQIKGAMIYPAFIISGLFVVGFLMMIFVIPQLTSIIAESGAELPLPTKILIFTSDFLKNFWWLILGGLGALAIAFGILVSKPEGRYYWNELQFRLPIFGELLKKIVLIRFSRSLYTLTTGGVPLTRSLEIVSDVVGNEVYKKLIRRTVKEVEDGNSVSAVFLKSPHVPVMVSQMLSLGEKTGRLDEILDKVAHFYSREAKNMVNNLITLLEPLVMLLMGIAVGGLVAAVILPLYSLASSL